MDSFGGLKVNSILILVIDVIDEIYNKFCLLPVLVQQWIGVWRFIRSLLSPLRDVDVLCLPLQGRRWLIPPLQMGDFLLS